MERVDEASDAERSHPDASGARVADASGVIAYTLDAGGTLVDISRAYAARLGGTPSALVGQHVTAIWPESTSTEILSIIEWFRRDPSVWVGHGERLRLRPGGRTQQVRFAVIAVRDEAGDLQRISVAGIEVGAPGVVEIAAPMGPEQAAAMRIGERAGLDPRDTHIVMLLASGYRVATIAAEVYLAPGTVRNRISAIGDALGVRGQPGILDLVHAEVRAVGNEPEGQFDSENVSPR